MKDQKQEMGILCFSIYCGLFCLLGLGAYWIVPVWYVFVGTVGIPIVALLFKTKDIGHLGFGKSEKGDFWAGMTAPKDFIDVARGDAIKEGYIEKGTSDDGKSEDSWTEEFKKKIGSIRDGFIYNGSIGFYNGDYNSAYLNYITANRLGVSVTTLCGMMRAGVLMNPEFSENMLARWAKEAIVKFDEGEHSPHAHVSAAQEIMINRFRPIQNDPDFGEKVRKLILEAEGEGRPA